MDGDLVARSESLWSTLNRLGVTFALLVARISRNLSLRETGGPAAAPETPAMGRGRELGMRLARADSRSEIPGSDKPEAGGVPAM